MVRTRSFVSITLFACCLFCCLTGGSCEKASETISNDGAAVNEEPPESESISPAASKQNEYKEGPKKNGSGRRQEQVSEPSSDLRLLFKEDSNAAPIQHLRRLDESEAFMPARREEEVTAGGLEPLVYGSFLSRESQPIKEDAERARGG